MIRPALRFLPLLLALPLSGQAWDLRLEGIRGSGAEEPGKGFILSAAHRIVRVNPVLKLEWCAEATNWGADAPFGELRQRGLGLGLNAQFWVPFTGLAGEMALIQRLQSFDAENGPASTHSRTWFRAGLRYRLPLPTPGPYLAVSWQACLAPPTQAPVERFLSIGIGTSF